jgi:hypothetical protein
MNKENKDNAGTEHISQDSPPEDSRNNKRQKIHLL